MHILTAAIHTPDGADAYTATYARKELTIALGDAVLDYLNDGMLPVGNKDNELWVITIALSELPLSLSELESRVAAVMADCRVALGVVELPE